jgi:uncharacterized protein (TIGR03067 family)
MKPSLFCVVLTAGLVVAADDKKEARTDQDRLKGSWKVVSVEVANRASGKVEKMTEDDIKKENKNVPLKWIFTGEKITWTDERKNEFLYKLDASKTPKEIDLIFAEKKDKPTQAIYLLDGDNLKVCIGRVKRPADFAVKEGSKDMLYVLKREKP